MTKCRKCKFRASYSRRGQPPAYCSLHKKPHHIRRHACKFPGCTTYPIYGFPSLHAERCKKHKTPSMVSYPYQRPNMNKPIDIREISTPCLMCSRPILQIEMHCKHCAERMILDLQMKLESDPSSVENEFLDLVNKLQENGTI